MLPTSGRCSQNLNALLIINQKKAMMVMEEDLFLFLITVLLIKFKILAIISLYVTSSLRPRCVKLLILFCHVFPPFQREGRDKEAVPQFDWPKTMRGRLWFCPSPGSVALNGEI